MGAKVGFDLFFFGFIDYQDRIKRKKLKVLIGYSIHCLCLMICLQMWNEKIKPLLICWFSGRTNGSLFSEIRRSLTFSLEDKGSSRGVLL